MKLKDYLESVPLSVIDFSKQINVSRQHVYDIMSKRARPGRFLKRRIEIETDGRVSLIDW